MSSKKLYLLDGHALVYRAHYAFISRPLINSKGQNTSAVTGFTRTIWDLIHKEHPTHIAVAFDTPKPTFRHVQYPEYKANREAQPEDISFAIPYIKKILKGFHIPILEVDGWEADDVIGTLCKQAEAEGFDVYMVTPDKDFGQLVSPHAFLYVPGKRGNGPEIQGVKNVCEKWGIERTEQVIDMLGLVGDSVDNIPGVPGIGPKTAAKLIKVYGSIEHLLDNTDDLKGKQKENLINFREQAILSKELATIDLKAPVQFDDKKYKIDPYDRAALSEVFKELEFRSLAKQILGEDVRYQAGMQTSLFGNEETKTSTSKAPADYEVAVKNIDTVDHSYHLVQSDDEVNQLVSILSKSKFICFDTETTGIDPNEAELVGMSFSIKKGEAWYVPLDKDVQLRQQTLVQFKSLFEDNSIVKIGQNIKYDTIVLKWEGVQVKGLFKDTMIAHYLLEPGLRHGMDYMAETYLKYKPVPIESIIGKKGKNQLTMRDVPVEKVKDYASEDADITYQLYDYLFPKLEEEKLQKLYSDMEEPLIKVLVDMEYEGVNVDESYLKNYSDELSGKILELENSIYEQAGVRFNIASPKQVGEVLFDRMKIPYRWRKTKTGQYSTDESKLTELSLEHNIVKDIMSYRGLAKLKSTYLDALPRMINPKTGRIHTSFNQALTTTGRLSSNNPNLQNIPVRTPEGAKVREAFVPRDENYILLAADYSQIELRLIAEISGEKAMLKAFQEGQDIHTATAARVFEVPYEEVTREQRYKAKTVNFSIIYGAGATNLSQQLDIKRAEAKQLIENYFKQYPGLKAYMDDVVSEAREKGFVTTLLGRRRYLRNINSRNGIMRSADERNAINSPVQGSAADMIKLAMIKVHKALKEGNFQTKMILQVHDELIFDVLKEELEAIKPLVEKNMREAMPGLQVPIVVDMGTGDNWLQAH